jgi:putative ABC transport system permease protein
MVSLPIVRLGGVPIVSGVDLAGKMLWDDRARFVATVAGVAFSVMLVLVQLGIFLGMLENASVTVERPDADLWVTARSTPNVDFANTYPAGYIHRVRSVPGVERADNLIVWFVTVAQPSGAKEAVLIYAMEDFTRWRLPWEVLAGDPADLRRGQYVFLDESARRRFGPFAIGEYREFLGRRLKIIGVTAGARSFTTNPIAFVDFRLAQSLYPDELRGRTTYTLVRLTPGCNREAVSAEIRRRLPHNDVYTREDWAARCRRYWVVNTGLGMSMTMTVFLGGLVGVVMVAQTLYASTVEHYKEFATVKAIGGSNADVYRVLVKQAAIAAVVGFAVGMVLARAVRPLMALLELKVILTSSADAYVFAGTFGLCLSASVLSFHKVARLDPAVVFRD